MANTNENQLLQSTTNSIKTKKNVNQDSDDEIKHVTICKKNKKSNKDDYVFIYNFKSKYG